jgi:hypothetical protein
MFVVATTFTELAAAPPKLTVEALERRRRRELAGS